MKADNNSEKLDKDNIIVVSINEAAGKYIQ